MGREGPLVGLRTNEAQKHLLLFSAICFRKGRVLWVGFSTLVGGEIKNKGRSYM